MNRNSLNRERTISDIKQSFIFLFSVTGIENISVKKICEKAGISRTLFYQYFNDKYDVLESIENDIISEMRQLNENLLETQLYKRKKEDPFPLFIETAEYIWKKQDIFRAFLGDPGDPHFIRIWKRQMCKDFARLISKDKTMTNNIDIVSEILASAIVGLYSYWLFEKPTLSYDEISRIGGNILFGSFYNFIK